MAHSDIKEVFDIMIEHQILMSYTGPFDGQVLSVIAENIEASLLANPTAGKKFFKIFIELAQNISFYSAETTFYDEDSSGIGTLVLKEYPDYFLLATGNIVETNQIGAVIEKCEKINTLDREGLREYKRFLRSQPRGEKGGGNIGLIQVALISGHKLEYGLLPLNEANSFYIVGVKVDK